MLLCIQDTSVCSNEHPPAPAIPHPPLTCTIQIYEVEMQAILFVSPLPLHLVVEGISRNKRG